MRVNTRKVVEAFNRGRKCEAARAVWTDGEAIYSYGTCIVAQLPGGGLVLNREKYSVTTSCQQNGLRVAFGDRIVAEVDGGNHAYPETLIERSKTLEASAVRAEKIVQTLGL